jgi:hypothetical protein
VTCTEVPAGVVIVSWQARLDRPETPGQLLIKLPPSATDRQLGEWLRVELTRADLLRQLSSLAAADLEVRFADARETA